MGLGFFFDQTRCTNCLACVVACKDWHDIPAGPASWMKVVTIEEGLYPQLRVSFLVQCCFHCAAPGCVAVCPTQAIQKRTEDGIVVVSPELCLGKDQCHQCREACPYSAPQFGAEENSKMQKCDLCLERLRKGLKPICVAACPMRALDAGPMEELISKHKGTREAVGLAFSHELKPSIVFRSRMKKP